MSIGQTIQKGFSVAGSSWNLVGVLFGFGLIWNFINLAVSPRIPAEGSPDAGTSAFLIAISAVFILLTIFFQAGSLGYVKEKIKGGNAQLSDFVSAGKRYYVSILAVAAAVTAIIGVFLLSAALSASVLPENLKAVGVVLALVLAALGLTFVVLLFFAPYIVVAENVKAMAAMKQSVGLVKKNAGALLLLSLLLILIGFGVGMVLGAIFAAISFVLKGMAAQIIFAALSSAVNAYLGLVVTGSFMALYLSLPKTNNN